METQNKTYLITYKMYAIGNTAWSMTGKMKVKNCMSDLHAKTKLEDYLRRKHSDFKTLVVLSCMKDDNDLFSVLFSNFGKNKR